MLGEKDKFQFNLLSVNIRGMNDRKKRRNVFRWVKKNKFDICFLQETYSTKDVENIWKNEWGGNILFSHGTSNSRGAMILIRPGFDAKIAQVYTDNIGRFLLADVIIQDTKFKLANIYAPNHEDDHVNFYNYLENKLKQYTQREDQIVVGGDFNFILDPKMDRKGGTGIKKTRKRERIMKHLENIKDYCQLKDIWRIKNPDRKRFTWRRVNPVIKSRLDIWLITEKTEDFVSETDIIPFNNTDHSAITLKLSSHTERGRGKGGFGD